VLVREGHRLNRKKIQRLWREEGLRVPPRRRKRQRLGTSTTPADRLGATRPDHVWALDYQFDVTTTGRTLKILHIVDEFTRESLADVVAYSIDADATVCMLDKIAGHRGGAPSRRSLKLAVFAQRLFERRREGPPARGSQGSETSGGFR
jgi:transposase InsO family protein